MESSFTILRVRGIPIGANWSWVLIFAFIIWTLAATIFPSTYPDLEQSTYLVMGVITGIIFFVSLLLHELGHALRALREGMEIEGITLWLFGGVARFKGMFPSAGAEFRIAIAGPLVTVALAALFGGATLALNGLGAPDQIVAVTDYLWRINGLLLGFNLVPALPLDGGRVLRAYLWHRQGNFSIATAAAARAGRAFGGVLIGIGLLGLFTGLGLGGLWPALIGWFLIQAAQSEAAYARFRQALRGLAVRNLMTPDPESVDPGRSISGFIEDVAHVRGHSTYPVVEGGRLAGLISLRLAARVPPERRGVTTVRDVMLPREEVPAVAPDADVIEAAAQIQGGPGRAVVLDDGQVVGILSASDIARALELEQVRGPREGEPRAGAVPWLVWIVVGAVILGFGAYLYHPPLVVIAPGKSFDVTDDIRIRGVPTDEVSGKYLLTSVAVEHPTGLGLAWAVVRSREIVPVSAVVPPDVETERFFEQQRRLFQESQMVSAAAAAEAAGLQVDVSGTGARIAGVLPGSPAAENLREGDVITEINGRPVRLAEDVSNVVRSRPSGTPFTLDIERAGSKRTVEVRSRARIIEGRPGIGIVVETRDFDIELPFRITFMQREIGGPSAGITYALAVYDMLVPDDLARGRAIASTGTMDFEGRVGPVGGVEEKTIAARGAGAELMLVPAEEVDAARGAGLDVQGVRSLKEAIKALS